MRIDVQEWKMGQERVETHYLLDGKFAALYKENYNFFKVKRLILEIFKVIFFKIVLG